MAVEINPWDRCSQEKQDRVLSNARYLNKLVEDDWNDRMKRRLPASGQAEAAYRKERNWK